MDLLAIISDVQIPFQDRRALSLTIDFLSQVKPTHLYIIGDWGDFYSISAHDRNPSRLFKLKEEIEEQIDELVNITSACRKAERFFIEGNHEDRLRRYLWQKAPELHGVGNLTIPELLKLKELGYKHLPYREGVFHNEYRTFYITHGDIVRAHSAFTAKCMLDRFGVSGISGHTHRLGSHYKRNILGQTGWWENGCLCTLSPDWVMNPDWQQGFTLVHIDEARFWVEQVPIIGGKLVYGGHLYG